MKPDQKLILLSNDDGIDSPGIWSAAEALSDLGYVVIAAPRDHMSATGRGFQRNSDGRVTTRKLEIKGEKWDAYAIGGSPSQAVAHGVLELAPRMPDLVVSGINYGENFGSDLTYSGTVGAALEAASLGIPALAMSRQILTKDWDNYPSEVQFTTAAFFTHYFADKMLRTTLPADVDVLNVVVPAAATPETEWVITRQAKVRYFSPYIHRKGSLEEDADIHSFIRKDEDIPPGTDMYVVRIEKKVAVTPLSLDLTSRVAPELIQAALLD